MPKYYYHYGADFLNVRPVAERDGSLIFSTSFVEFDPEQTFPGLSAPGHYQSKSILGPWLGRKITAAQGDDFDSLPIQATTFFFAT